MLTTQWRQSGICSTKESLPFSLEGHLLEVNKVNMPPYWTADGHLCSPLLWTCGWCCRWERDLHGVKDRGTEGGTHKHALGRQSVCSQLKASFTNSYSYTWKFVNFFESTVQLPFDLLICSLEMHIPDLLGMLIPCATLTAALNSSISPWNHLHFLPAEYWTSSTHSDFPDESNLQGSYSTQKLDISVPHWMRKASGSSVTVGSRSYMRTFKEKRSHNPRVIKS